MIPGGGLEAGETNEECCVREVAEETGLIVKPSGPVLEIDEYYEDCRYISMYFLCEKTGETGEKLTEGEIKAGLEPRWSEKGRGGRVTVSGPGSPQRSASRWSPRPQSPWVAVRVTRPPFARSPPSPAQSPRGAAAREVATTACDNE